LKLEADNLKLTQADEHDFLWSTLPGPPHEYRRAAILKAHPEVKTLFGREWSTKYIVTFVVCLQLSAGFAVRNMFGTWQFFTLAYVVGATCCQCLNLAVHEVSHMLAFKKFWHNKMLMLFANLTHVVPYVMTFRGYHLEHHKFLGVDGVDTDLPTAIEARILSTRLGKLFFLSNMYLFYIFRPALIRFQEYTFWHWLNVLVQIVFNAIIISLFGWGMFFYFLTSVMMSLSLHPTAGHFIAEHYIFEDIDTSSIANYSETYSYYGCLNWVTFNAGYHNEHHDFPNIPWTKLPALKKMCPEFYDPLPKHNSWVGVMWNFIMKPHMRISSRVKRVDTDGVIGKPCGSVLNKSD